MPYSLATGQWPAWASTCSHGTEEAFRFPNGVLVVPLRDNRSFASKPDTSFRVGPAIRHPTWVVMFGG